MTDLQQDVVHSPEEIVVKVLYDYSYYSANDQKNLTFKAGEEYYLVFKTSENWWYVKRNLHDQEGIYIPAQYVEEIRREGTVAPIHPVSAPVSDNKTKPKLSPKLSKSEVEITPMLDKEAIDELNDILESLKVPEPFQDQTNRDSVTTFRDQILSGGDLQQLPSNPQNQPPSNSEHDHLDRGKHHLDRDSKDELRVESETSDYKTDSRESLDSEGQGLEIGEDVGGKGAVVAGSAEVSPGPRDGESSMSEDSKAPKLRESRNVVRSESMDDYANLLEIQKAIQLRNSSAVAPPLADNLLPPGYCKPYQEEAKTVIRAETQPTSNVSEVPPSSTIHPSSSIHSFVGRKDGTSERVDGSRHSVVVESMTTSKRRSIFSLKKSQSASVQLVKFINNTPSTSPIFYAQISESQSEASVEQTRVVDDDDDSFVGTGISKMAPKMVDKQGALQKAKVEENSKKMKKGWSQSYVVLCQNLLYFYKDLKSSSAKPRSVTSLGKPEFVVDLKDAKLTNAPEDKNVKRDAFMLITTTKTHYLLHHDDVNNNQHWRQSIQNNINALEAGLLPEATDSLGKRKTELATSPSCDVIESKQTIADRLKNLLLRRPTKESIKKKGIYKEVIFGSSITSICDREKGKVPRFVKECIMAIEERGLDVDGLYRVSGNMATVQKLRSMVDQNEFYDLHQTTWDVHAVTGALKLFFRELSEPLFTFKLFQPFLSSMNNLNAVKDLIKQLPPAHHKTMKLLFKHLTLVLQHSKENRMQVHGLAIVFGPTLMWSENASKDVNLAASLVQQGQLVEYVISNCKAIFG